MPSCPVRLTPSAASPAAAVAPSSSRRRTGRPTGAGAFGGIPAVPTGASVSAARAAAASSPAVGYRFSGSLAIPLATTGSKPAGTSGRAALGFGGGVCTCAYITASGSSFGNGGVPTNSSYSTQASA